MSKLKPGDDFSFYQAARDAGASATDVHARMQKDGLDVAARVRGLRHLFGLSFDEASALLAGGEASLVAARARALEELAALDAEG